MGYIYKKHILDSLDGLNWSLNNQIMNTIIHTTISREIYQNEQHVKYAKKFQLTQSKED